MVEFGLVFLGIHYKDKKELQLINLLCCNLYPFSKFDLLVCLQEKENSSDSVLNVYLTKMAILVFFNELFVSYENGHIEHFQ